jgi:hypothetical protein
MKEKTMRATQIALICLLVNSGLLAQAQTDFRIQTIQRNPDETITLTWPAMGGRTYHLLCADSPDGFWWDRGWMWAPGTNPLTMSYTDFSAMGASQRFYKVRRERAELVMTLVLDHSGSMYGAGTYLTAAVTVFLGYFDDNTDQAAMVSFATTASVNVPMGRPFKSAITAATGNFVYNGATFAQGGLTNALVQDNSVVPGPGEGVVKVAVFFTDGMANIVQDTLNCGGTPTLLNFGGYDTGQLVGLFSPSNGGGVACNATTFNSAVSGPNTTLNGTNVRADAAFRTVQVANDMRAAGMHVYSIGLGTGVNMTFLQQVANDPNSPTFNPAQPIGEAVVATSLADLSTAFEEIASKILAN